MVKAPGKERRRSDNSQNALPMLLVTGSQLHHCVTIRTSRLLHRSGARPTSVYAMILDSSHIRGTSSCYTISRSTVA